jgi:hypothetical protein
MAEIANHELQFDVDGRLTYPEAESALAQDVERGRTTLFVMAHGWNNNEEVARRLFESFFATIGAFVPDNGKETVATVGVIWPSMRWPDEPAPAGATGGAASMSGSGQPDDEALVTQLATFFPDPRARRALGRLGELLRERPRDPRAVVEFQQLLKQLSTGPDLTDPDDSRVDAPLLQEPPEKIFRSFADLSVDASAGGAAGRGDAWTRIWRGAKEGLRATTYFEMKKRAGVVGRLGLGPLIGNLPRGARVTLIGHSFGARLVSFALAGLAASATGTASPVKGLFLVQGAFSHYTFAARHPFHPGGGALADLTDRVDGPVVVTYTAKDLALATFYPQASLVSGDDTAGLAELLRRWGAMGYDGAQEVAGERVVVKPVRGSYSFGPRRFVNLDCNALIKDGPWPMGAHSDIVHDELGWVAASMAGVTGG